MITARTVMRLRTGPSRLVRMEAQWAYAQTDPYAVRLGFPAMGNSATWVFGRELLAAGLVDDCGEGDVRIEPADARHTYLVFTDRRTGNVAMLLAPTNRIADFLACSYRLVPRGSEHRYTDWDSCIRQLLGRTGRPTP